MAEKWYVKFFKRLVNVAVNNAFVVYNSKNKTHLLTFHLDPIKALILTHKPQARSPAGPGRPSINPPPERLLGRNFIENAPATGNKANPQTSCGVFLFAKEREGVDLLVSGLQSRLVVEPCFRLVHTQADLYKFSQTAETLISTTIIITSQLCTSS